MPTSPPRSLASEHEPTEAAVAADGPRAAPVRTLDAPGLACVDLTPLIAQSMATLQPGQVLQVRTDDPAARVGVPAWCRLTRNTLVAAHEDLTGRSTNRTTFHIAKKES